MAVAIGEGDVWCEKRKVFAFLAVFFHRVRRGRRLWSGDAQNAAGLRNVGVSWRQDGATGRYIVGEAEFLEPSEIRRGDGLTRGSLLLLDGLLEVLDGGRVRRLNPCRGWNVRRCGVGSLRASREPHDKDHDDSNPENDELLRVLRKQASGLRCLVFHRRTQLRS